MGHAIQSIIVLDKNVIEFFYSFLEVIKALLEVHGVTK